MKTTTKQCRQCMSDFSGPAFEMQTKVYCSHACYAESRLIDLSGQKFGRLTIKGRGDGKKWRWICECGNESQSQSQAIRSGKTTSCGCAQKEAAASRLKTHGGSDTRAHNSWDSMIQRCTNPKSKQFANYGGRGIAVCERWTLFENFLADMGQPPDGCSIERVENDKGYSPENCVWATKKEQQRNRRVNRLIEIDGRSQCLTAWSEETGVPVTTIYGRLSRGWSERDAITRPSA